MSSFSLQAYGPRPILTRAAAAVETPAGLPAQGPGAAGTPWMPVATATLAVTGPGGPRIRRSRASDRALR
jgi:hypothetical protein